MSSRHGAEADRRGFLAGTGLVLLSALALPAIAWVSEASPPDGPAPADTLVIRSGPGFVPHTHNLWIPYALLRSPPATGVTLISRPARGHTHQVALSRADLVAVDRGGTVSVNGGSHTFVIATARAISVPAQGSRSDRSGA